MMSLKFSSTRDHIIHVYRMYFLILAIMHLYLSKIIYLHLIYEVKNSDQNVQNEHISEF